jgi:hypothetical protein
MGRPDRNTSQFTAKEEQARHDRSGQREQQDGHVH